MADIEKFEKVWFEQSDEVDFEFIGYPGPLKFRRPQEHSDVVCFLQFGGFQDFDDKWSEDGRVVWLAGIASEAPGAGSRFLDALVLLADDYKVAIAASPQTITPKNWSRERPPPCGNDLLNWYSDHKFLIIQQRAATRVWYVPWNLKLDVRLALT